jgi:hypothetical protein
MKLKLINVISIFIVIILVGTILGQWQKENFSVTFVNDKNANSTLSRYIEDVYNSGVDYENKITELEKVLKDKGPIDVIKYNKLLEDAKNEIDMNLENKQKLSKFIMNNKIYEDKVNNLNSEISTIENELQILSSAQPTQAPRLLSNKNYSIKSIKYGISVSVRELSSNNVMIFLNNGCLTYNDNNNYSVKYCEISNPKQLFKINNVLNSNNICTVSPMSDSNMYLKIDDKGLSFIKYISTSNVVPNSNKYPSELLWTYSESNFNECKKMEENKITLL